MSKDTNNSETKRTVVEEGTQFKGDLTSTCPVDVRGRVEGQVEAPSLCVSAAGAVHGRAKVGSVRSEGELSGEFEAETIELSGTVKDQTVIRARSIHVRLASEKGQQVVFGDCELSIGDEPTEHDVIEEPVALATEAAAEEVVHAAEASAETAGSAAVPSQDEQGSGAAADVGASEAHASADGEAPVDASDSDTQASPQTAQASDNIDADDIVEEGGQAADEAPATLEEALAAEVEADAGNGKKKGKGKKRKNENGAAQGGDTTSGWSTPPSQPPPAE